MPNFLFFPAVGRRGNFTGNSISKIRQYTVVCCMEEIAKAKREGMVPGHLVQTSSSSMQIKTELFYEHLLSEHWLVSALYKKNQDWVGPRITCWGFRTKWSHGIDNTPNLSTKLI